MFFLLSNLLIFQFLSILSHIGIVYFSCNASCLHICIKHQLPRLNTDYSAICVLNTTTCKGVWQKKNQNTNVKYLIKFKYKIRLKKKTCSANLIKNTITIFILRYYVLRLRWGVLNNLESTLYQNACIVIWKRFFLLIFLSWNSPSP